MSSAASRLAPVVLASLAAACGGSAPRPLIAPAARDAAPKAPALPVPGGGGPCRLEPAGAPPVAAPAAAEPLAAEWAYRAAPGRSIDFAGVQDGDGNLYWIEVWPQEDGRPAFELVSASRDGAVRWRAPAAHDAWRLLFVSGGLLVVGGALRPEQSWPYWEVLDAHDAATGALAWSADLSEAIRSLTGAEAARPYVGTRAPAVAAGTIHVPASAVDASGSTRPGLLRLDLATGALREVRGLAGPGSIWMPSDAAALADGRAFLSARPGEGESALLGFADVGAPEVEVERAEADHLWLVGASDRHLLEAGAREGDPAWSGPFLQWSGLEGTPLGRIANASGEPLAAGADLWLVAGARVSRFELAGCAVAWDRTVARAPAGGAILATAAIRTAGDGILLGVQEVALAAGGGPLEAVGPARAVELGPDGAERRRGLLPEGFLLGRAATLHAGRWFVSGARRDAAGQAVAELAAFDLRGVEPASSGWVTSDGTPSRERRALATAP